MKVDYCNLYLIVVIFFLRFKLIDGELLSELRKMQQSAPESFYSALRNDMNFDLITCLKFTNALDYL